MSNVKIIKSVGIGGVNTYDDIKTIQINLNKVLNLITPTKRLSEDGKLGRFPEKSKTVAAIKIFQKKVLNMVRPDGRIDPNGKTIKKLNNCILEKKANSSAKVKIIEPAKIEKNSALTWDVHTNRRILTLHPYVKAPAASFINTVENELGITLRITQARRTIEEQNALYAQGRTTDGNKVTKVKGGYSFHNYGLAIDIVEIKDKNANWNPDWKAIAKIGIRHGFEWGGNWKTFIDKPHFQMTFGLSIQQLLNGERP
ncbi:M15 family metallopeptidase [Photobacterium nomapromontoriensis]|uniref:M15 family metallopeptidase n=1 Tax=Photobacterium nomapromontoriensis TaxID=2910237 RepID=UPI003D0BAC3F